MSMEHFFTSLFSFCLLHFAVMESSPADDVKSIIVMMCMFIDIWPRKHGKIGGTRKRKTCVINDRKRNKFQLHGASVESRKLEL